jgi:hypothetical protein
MFIVCVCKNLKNMPTCKTQYKYKCCELACGKTIRGDKWNCHCKKEHGYKLKAGHEIRRKLIAVKEGNGPWQPGAGSSSGASGQQVKLC